MSLISDVAAELKNLKSDDKTLHSFARQMGSVFIVLFAVFHFYFKSEVTQFVFFTIGTVFFFLDIAALKLVRYFQLGWMGIIFFIGWFMSRIILTAVFFFIVGPLGFIAKLFGKDFLKLKLDKNTSSYWIKKEEEKSGYDKMY